MSVCASEVVRAPWADKAKGSRIKGKNDDDDGRQRQNSRKMNDDALKKTIRSGGCRLCLAPDTECVPIFATAAADKEPLSNKILSCVNIKVSEKRANERNNKQKKKKNMWTNSYQSHRSIIDCGTSACNWRVVVGWATRCDGREEEKETKSKMSSCKICTIYMEVQSSPDARSDPSEEWKVKISRDFWLVFDSVWLSHPSNDFSTNLCNMYLCFTATMYGMCAN